MKNIIQIYLYRLNKSKYNSSISSSSWNPHGLISFALLYISIFTFTFKFSFTFIFIFRFIFSAGCHRQKECNRDFCSKQIKETSYPVGWTCQLFWFLFLFLFLFLFYKQIKASFQPVGWTCQLFWWCNNYNIFDKLITESFQP